MNVTLNNKTDEVRKCINKLALYLLKFSLNELFSPKQLVNADLADKDTKNS